MISLNSLVCFIPLDERNGANSSDGISRDFATRFTACICIMQMLCSTPLVGSLHARDFDDFAFVAVPVTQRAQLLVGGVGRCAERCADIEFAG